MCKQSGEYMGTYFRGLTQVSACVCLVFVSCTSQFLLCNKQLQVYQGDNDSISFLLTHLQYQLGPTDLGLTSS